VRIVVALGGNALLRRGEAMTVDNQQANVELACDRLAPIAEGNELVVAHGNGPQIGLLALEGAAYEAVPPYPLDVLGAETQGMVGYLIERELGNRLPFERPIATLLTMIEVDRSDPAFQDPSKPIGPLYDADQAEKLATTRGWEFRRDGASMRRVVPSPPPKRIFEDRQIHWLLERGCVVICAGGGGIPTTYESDRQLVGVEAVIDKDHAGGLLARDLSADLFVMATDTPGAYVGFGTPAQQLIASANPDELLVQHRAEFAAGSMLPKVTAACNFARTTGNPAVIGALSDIDALVAGSAGTRITPDVHGIVTTPSPPEED
jgi:carbamate kinase